MVAAKTHNCLGPTLDWEQKKWKLGELLYILWKYFLQGESFQPLLIAQPLDALEKKTPKALKTSKGGG